MYHFDTIMRITMKHEVFKVDLKAARLRNGWSQEYVANLVGITRPAYTNIERGDRLPSVLVAKRIGKVLDIPWASIFEEIHDTEAQNDTGRDPEIG